jgi:uncharacterized protein YbjT (DUF2867 family)
VPPIDGQPADVSIADPRCLVTGATGYVGGRLVPRLLKRGYAVRALARTPAKLSEVPWRADVEVAEGDLDDVESLAAAFDGVDVVYYLVHSMGTSADYASEEDRSATNVVAAARAAGVRRLIYLGGLHPTGRELSAHMTSRASVGQHLLDSGIEAVVLQAGVIIGSGSASFEMVRHLTDVLPVMTTPKWVHNQIQPIAIHDVLHYLVEAATADIGQSRTWDIGGPDILDYGEMMQIYAEAAGLAKRRILVLPLLTPTLASLWVGLVTPIPSGLARPLVESLQNDAVTSEHDIDGVIAAPAEGLTSYRRAVALSLEGSEKADIGPTWSDASPLAAPWEPLPSDPKWAGVVAYMIQRAASSVASAAELWKAVEADRDRNRWRAFPLAWPVRGSDRWTVEAREPGALRLRTKLGVPGQAWLEITVTTHGASSRCEQRATFYPRGLAGRLYWFVLRPAHVLALRAMAKAVIGRAEKGLS